MGQLHRLGQEVLRTEPHATYRGIDVTRPGEHDHARPVLPEPLQDVKPIEVGQVEIENHHFRSVALERLYPVQSPSLRDDLVVQPLQVAAQRPEDRRVVVHQEDGAAHRTPPGGSASGTSRSFHRSHGSGAIADPDLESDGSPVLDPSRAPEGLGPDAELVPAGRDPALVEGPVREGLEGPYPTPGGVHQLQVQVAHAHQCSGIGGPHHAARDLPRRRQRYVQTAVGRWGGHDADGGFDRNQPRVRDRRRVRPHRQGLVRHEIPERMTSILICGHRLTSHDEPHARYSSFLRVTLAIAIRIDEDVAREPAPLQARPGTDAQVAERLVPLYGTPGHLHDASPLPLGSEELGDGAERIEVGRDGETQTAAEAATPAGTHLHARGGRGLVGDATFQAVHLIQPRALQLGSDPERSSSPERQVGHAGHEGKGRHAPVADGGIVHLPAQSQLHAQPSRLQRRGPLPPGKSACLQGLPKDGPLDEPAR